MFDEATGGTKVCRYLSPPPPDMSADFMIQSAVQCVDISKNVYCRRLSYLRIGVYQGESSEKSDGPVFTAMMRQPADILDWDDIELAHELLNANAHKHITSKPKRKTQPTVSAVSHGLNSALPKLSSTSPFSLRLSAFRQHHCPDESAEGLLEEFSKWRGGELFNVATDTEKFFGWLGQRFNVVRPEFYGVVRDSLAQFYRDIQKPKAVASVPVLLEQYVAFPSLAVTSLLVVMILQLFHKFYLCMVVMKLHRYFTVDALGILERKLSQRYEGNSLGVKVVALDAAVDCNLHLTSVPRLQIPPLVQIARTELDRRKKLRIDVFKESFRVGWMVRANTLVF